MKTRTIEDTYGDICTVRRILTGKVEVTTTLASGGDTTMFFSPAQARELRKALKRALRA